MATTSRGGVLRRRIIWGARDIMSQRSLYASLVQWQGDGTAGFGTARWGPAEVGDAAYHVRLRRYTDRIGCMLVYITDLLLHKRIRSGIL